MIDATPPLDPSGCLEEVARHEPDRLLIDTSSGERLSYSQVAQLCGRISAALAARGVRPGDRVVAQVEKSPEAVALYLATLRIGGVFVPLNTAYTSAELEYFLADAAPTLLVGRESDLNNLRDTARRAGVEQIETLNASGGGSLMQLAHDAGGSIPERFRGEPSVLAALLYTSGTTGRSKGAMLTRRNLTTNAATLAREWHFTADDVLLHALPIFHVHGLFVAINTVLASGSSMLFHARFDIEEIMRSLPRATVMMGVPTFYTRLLQHAGFTREKVAAMRLFVSGSAPLLAETHRQFEARTGHSILERYGMSETLMNTSNPYDGRRVPGSVGPALPDVEVRITDPQTGAELREADAVGMIEVRGPNVFAGYWRMPEKTAAEFRGDGFFITGDLGRIDANGYVHIVGRGKDLIISGGYNVYPIEVETEIDAVPGVAESAVIGAPHPDLGEGVTAVVVRKPGQPVADEHSIRAVLEQRLARYKLPKRIVFVEDLPRNAMGKVQKALLREAYKDMYGSEGR